MGPGGWGRGERQETCLPACTRQAPTPQQASVLVVAVGSGGDIPVAGLRACSSVLSWPVSHPKPEAGRTADTPVPSRPSSCLEPPVAPTAPAAKPTFPPRSGAQDVASGPVSSRNLRASPVRSTPSLSTVLPHWSHPHPSSGVISMSPPEEAIHVICVLSDTVSGIFNRCLNSLPGKGANE